jgi:hypothetical protein
MTGTAGRKAVWSKALLRPGGVGSAHILALLINSTEAGNLLRGRISMQCHAPERGEADAAAAHEDA